MKDAQLRILFLSKLYESNRNGASILNIKEDELFKDVDENQWNFCFQYLGTLNLIQYSSSNRGAGLYTFNPLYIAGKGIDIVESLMEKITTKLKNSVIENSSSVVEKIPIFIAHTLENPDFWDTVIEIFEKLIDAMMVIF